MINRWQGNTGRVQRVPEREVSMAVPPQRPQPPAAAPMLPMSRPRQKGPPLPPLFSPPKKKKGGLLSGLEGLGRLLPMKTEELETEDIILLLILYLMYRESGDSELLMIMGAMFLL